jgi:hypothetical protein
LVDLDEGLTEEDDPDVCGHTMLFLMLHWQ